MLKLKKVNWTSIGYKIMDLPFVMQLTNHTIVKAIENTHQIAQYLVLANSSIGFLSHNATYQ
jgi:hypothetical protein